MTSISTVFLFKSSFAPWLPLGCSLVALLGCSQILCYCAPKFGLFLLTVCSSLVFSFLLCALLWLSGLNFPDFLCFFILFPPNCAAFPAKNSGFPEKTHKTTQLCYFPGYLGNSNAALTLSLVQGQPPQSLYTLDMIRTLWDPVYKTILPRKDCVLGTVLVSRSRRSQQLNFNYRRASTALLSLWA